MTPSRSFQTLALSVVTALACSNPTPTAEDAGVTTYSLDVLMDPVTCQGCHPNHYQEWSGSMHAYAARDPVFHAMNALGQQATGGALGSFCIHCHAPLAVKLGLTQDGLNLDTVPEHLSGITCFYCHATSDVTSSHNNPLTTAMDGVMRGGFTNPMPNPAHRSEYSALHARDDPRSATLCGSCHDIVTPNGLHLERTFLEWQQSLYARDPTQGGLTCAACHMEGRNEPASNMEGSPVRRSHSHAWPGVDVALTPFPNMEAQRALVQHQLDTTLLSELCVFTDGSLVDMQVTLENVAAGHAFPSGASQDRRVWVDLTARKDGNVVFQSGHVEPGFDVTRLGDPNLCLMGDRLFDAAGAPTHHFWDAVTLQSRVLPYPTALRMTDPGWTNTHVTRTFIYPGGIRPDEVELHVRVQPIGYDVLDELVNLGLLDPAVADLMPVFTLAAASQLWRLTDGNTCVGAQSTPVTP